MQFNTSVYIHEKFVQKHIQVACVEHINRLLNIKFVRSRQPRIISQAISHVCDTKHLIHNCMGKLQDYYH